MPATVENEPAITSPATAQVDELSWPEQAREVLLNALSLTGVRYQYGGNSPESGFDCSGFVRYVYQQATSLSLPHSARAISQLGKTIPKQELKPGDLVFFNTLKSAFSHVGIYVGNNRFIHAPSSGGGVRVEDMQNSYWQKRYNGAQRIDSTKTTD
ncbi:MAG: C40 family peptidase [Methylotenera sp.]|nr:C40 family peptidase [Methylotenera sp.]